MCFVTWAGESSKITKSQGRRGSCLQVVVLLNTVCAEVDEASVSERHQNHQNPGGGGHVLKSTPFAQHQSVLMQTELVCLSITIITKKQGRGAPCWEG